MFEKKRMKREVAKGAKFNKRVVLAGTGRDEKRINVKGTRL